MVNPVCPTEIQTGFLPSVGRTLILVGLPNVGNLRVTQKMGVVRATLTLVTTYRTAGCGNGEDRLKLSVLVVSLVWTTWLRGRTSYSMFQ